MMLDPSLRGKAVAVCGSTEDRHGILLAKSEAAKKAGVKTGMPIWEVKQCCPDIIIVPPNYDQYLKYSKLARSIYQRYTDQVEPFGMDECWLDLSGSVGLFGSGHEIAERIRKEIREELGMTVSIGVSFNKIFAKLGSDMKKPDAVTIITKDNFREKVWPLPCSELLYCGRATTKKLAKYNIHTIGDIARTEPEFLQQRLGVNGLALWSYAAGLDNSRVMHKDFVSPIKSLGHGITCVADLNNSEEVWRVILELSQDIGHRLRVHKLAATGVQITIRDNGLMFKQYQGQLLTTTQSPMIIASKARELFDANYQWGQNVRALTVRAINLVEAATPQQTSLYIDPVALLRKEKLDDTVEDIRRRFGKRAIINASLLGDIKVPNHSAHDVVMPGMMYK